MIGSASTIEKGLVKKAALLDASRKVIVEAENVYNKIRNTLTFSTVTPKMLNGTIAKISDKLSESCIDIFMVGVDGDHKKLDNDEGSLMVDKLGKLRGKLECNRALIEKSCAAEKTSAASAAAVCEAYAAAKSTGDEPCAAASVLCIARVSTELFDAKDYEGFAKAVAADNEGIVGFKTLFPDKALREDNQEKAIMKRLMELGRMPDKVLELKEVLRCLNEASIENEEFKTQVGDMCIYYGAIEAEMTPELHALVVAARQRIAGDGHRFRKLMDMFSGGKKAAGMIELSLLQLEKDKNGSRSVENVLRKMQSASISIPLQLTEQQANDKVKIVIPNTSGLVDVLSLWAAMCASTSKHFKDNNVESLDNVDVFFKVVATSIRGSLTIKLKVQLQPWAAMLLQGLSGDMDPADTAEYLKGLQEKHNDIHDGLPVISAIDKDPWKFSAILPQEHALEILKGVEQRSELIDALAVASPNLIHMLEPTSTDAHATVQSDGLAKLVEQFVALPAVAAEFPCVAEIRDQVKLLTTATIDKFVDVTVQSYIGFCKILVNLVNACPPAPERGAKHDEYIASVKPLFEIEEVGQVQDNFDHIPGDIFQRLHKTLTPMIGSDYVANVGLTLPHLVFAHMLLPLGQHIASLNEGGQATGKQLFKSHATTITVIADLIAKLVVVINRNFDAYQAWGYFAS